MFERYTSSSSLCYALYIADFFCSWVRTSCQEISKIFPKTHFRCFTIKASSTAVSSLSFRGSDESMSGGLTRTCKSHQDGVVKVVPRLACCVSAASTPCTYATTSGRDNNDSGLFMNAKTRRPSKGQPLSYAHFSISRWPLYAACVHVQWSHGHPFRRTILSSSRWPLAAADAHVQLSHVHSWSRAYFRISCRLIFAASAHVSVSHGHLF
jgi:hypothetical protein